MSTGLRSRDATLDSLGVLERADRGDPGALSSRRRVGRDLWYIHDDGFTI